MRTKKTKSNARKFLKVLRETGNVSKAAETIGVSRQTVNNWKKSDEIFARRWEDAIEAFLDDFEETCFERAKNGAEYETTTGDGEVVTVRSKPSDSLAKYLLTARRYRQQKDDEFVKKHLHVHLHKMSDEQLAQIASEPDAPPALPPGEVHDAILEEEEEADELMDMAVAVREKVSH